MTAVLINSNSSDCPGGWYSTIGMSVKQTVLYCVQYSLRKFSNRFADKVASHNMLIQESVSFIEVLHIFSFLFLATR